MFNEFYFYFMFILCLFYIYFMFILCLFLCKNKKQYKDINFILCIKIFKFECKTFL